MPLRIPNCRKFTGYRPCEPYKNCLNCADKFPFGTKILIINLDHLGDVLMTTAQLPAMKRKYPESFLVWITLENALPLLLHNPFVDRTYAWNDENRMLLQAMQFDCVFNADKNQNSAAFTMSLNARKKFGFGLNENGIIIPLNPGAEYNYRLGLDDDLKFNVNQKTGQQILADTFAVDYQRDEYVLNLTAAEHEFCQQQRQAYGIQKKDVVVGFNTGCSAQFPYKKMSVAQHVSLINRLLAYSPHIKILLLGGPAETEINQEIKSGVAGRVIATPTTEGIRKGILSLNLCDIVVSGDTSGLHIAIGLQKKIVVWFGMSAAAEIDLYERGTKIYSKTYFEKTWNMAQPDPRCVEKLDLNQVFQAIVKYVNEQLNQK